MSVYVQHRNREEIMIDNNNTVELTTTNMTILSNKLIKRKRAYVECDNEAIQSETTKLTKFNENFTINNDLLPNEIYNVTLDDHRDFMTFDTMGRRPILNIKPKVNEKKRLIDLTDIQNHIKNSTLFPSTQLLTLCNESEFSGTVKFTKPIIPEQFYVRTINNVKVNVCHNYVRCVYRDYQYLHENFKNKLLVLLVRPNQDQYDQFLPKEQYLVDLRVDVYGEKCKEDYHKRNITKHNTRCSAKLRVRSWNIGNNFFTNQLPNVKQLLYKDCIEANVNIDNVDTIIRQIPPTHIKVVKCWGLVFSTSSKHLSKSYLFSVSFIDKLKSLKQSVKNSECNIECEDPTIPPELFATIFDLIINYYSYQYYRNLSVIVPFMTNEQNRDYLEYSEGLNDTQKDLFANCHIVPWHETPRHSNSVDYETATTLKPIYDLIRYMGVSGALLNQSYSNTITVNSEGVNISDDNDKDLKININDCIDKSIHYEDIYKITDDDQIEYNTVS